MPTDRPANNASQNLDLSKLQLDTNRESVQMSTLDLATNRVGDENTQENKNSNSNAGAPPSLVREASNTEVKLPKPKLEQTNLFQKRATLNNKDNNKKKQPTSVLQSSLQVSLVIRH